MKMNKNKLMLIMMIVLTSIAFGGVIFAYSQRTPELAVLVSFASIVFNYAARANITTT